MHTNIPPYLRILYVEDDKNAQEEVAFFLESLVAALYIASNGEEGYQLHLLHKPDLIITDIQMPIMNGIDMIKKIRQSNLKTPIFITTAYNETNYLLSAINSGVDRYILKPINFKTLAETISEYYTSQQNDHHALCINRDGRIMNVTQNFEDLSGYTLDEIIHTSLENYIDPKDRTNYQNFLSNIDSLHEHRKKTILFRHKDGTTLETVLYEIHNHDPLFQLELKTLQSYIHQEEVLNKSLKSERFIKELIKMNSNIYKEINQAKEKKVFLQHITSLFTNNDLFEFAFVSYADESGLLWVAEQGDHPQINVQTLFSTPLSLSDVQCPITEVIKNQEIILIEDLSTFSPFDTKTFWLNHGVTSMAILPLYKKSLTQKKGAFTLSLNQAYFLNNEVLELLKNITEALNMGLQSIEDQKEREQLEIQLREELAERKKNEMIIQQFAFYDPLTQLPNRRLFSDYLGKSIASCKRNGHFSALLFLDLDNFKPLNDTYGHALGDLLLIEVAQRIKQAIRESDVVARFGGDEFVIVLQELSEQYVSSIAYAQIAAEKIRTALSEPYRLPLTSEEQTLFIEHYCTSSIGIALFGADAVDETQLIKQADSAMYVAKETGRNQIVVHTIHRFNI